MLRVGRLGDTKATLDDMQGRVPSRPQINRRRVDVRGWVTIAVYTVLRVQLEVPRTVLGRSTSKSSFVSQTLTHLDGSTRY